MRWKVGVALILLSALGCRYRFSPGIYVPLQVGTLYRYTSRRLISGEYEKPQGRFYTPDTLYVLGDTTFRGLDARKVYIKKQLRCEAGYSCSMNTPKCVCSIDTAIYYFSGDTLTSFSDIASLFPPAMETYLGGRPVMIRLLSGDRDMPFSLFVSTAGPGDAWEVASGRLNLVMYPLGFGDVPDSVREYDLNFTIRARLEGFEDVSTSYRYFRACAKVRYDLTLSGDVPDLTLHTLDTWWCDGVGQVKLVQTPEAASYGDTSITYVELSFVEYR